jgi:hypothetical protein
MFLPNGYELPKPFVPDGFPILRDPLSTPRAG